MPWPLLFTTKHDIKNLDTATSIEIPTKEDDEDKEEYNWHELTIEEHDSLFPSLYRIYVHWRRILSHKLRLIFTLIFVRMLNLATRLPCFTREKNSVRSTTSSLSPIVTLPSNRTFENDFNHSSTSFLNFTSPVDLPSTETSSMAHMLVQHQTPNINIHQTKSRQDENRLPMAHSVDDRLFLYQPDSTSFFHFLQKFASEPQISKFPSITNEFSDKKLSLSPLNKPEENIYFNGDHIQPVIPDNVRSNELDNISTVTNIDDFDEDILLNTNSSLNIERHFRRRKRRSSLTKISPSNEEIEPMLTDSIEKIDDNNNSTIPERKSSEILPITTNSLLLDENNQKKEVSNDKTTLPNRLQGRRLRYRSHRHTSAASEEPESDQTVQFFLPTEIPISTPPTSPPPSSNSSTGSLKRTGPIVTTSKKMVRFADSVGRELAQVQYIQPLIDDEDHSKEFSLLKTNLYVPKTNHSEHKPWSFDVALPSKQISDSPRRFFCLFRQPNSEHPDVYLHEIWKSQIKLEYADIRLKPFSTGEQYLHGSIWVTNASYWKNVTVKYTFNRWLNTYEYEAQHRCHSNDFRNIDQFEFNIDIPHDVDRIDFVLRYYVNGQEHWDNNEGKNYTLETESASTPQTTISLPHDCDFNEMRFY